jgi:type II secretory pathway component PulC
MRTVVLKRLIWTLNALLLASAGYLAWWAVSFEAAPSASSSLETRSGSEDHSSGGEIPGRAGPSVADLKAVFSRNFAPSASSSAGGEREEETGEDDRSPTPEPLPRSAGDAASQAPSFLPGAASKPSIPPLSSQVTLAAIFHDPTPGSSGVVLRRNGAAGQELYWEGDTVQAIDAKVLKVEENAVRFRYHGAAVELKLPEERGISEPSGPAATRQKEPSTGKTKPFWTIDQAHYHAVPHAEVVDVVQKPVQALRGIRYTLAEDDNGNVLGFRVTGISPGSVFERYGLRDKDIVRALNGRDIDANFDPLLAMGEVLASPLVQVKVRRDGQEIVLSFEVKK